MKEMVILEDKKELELRLLELSKELELAEKEEHKISLWMWRVRREMADIKEKIKALEKADKHE